MCVCVCVCVCLCVVSTTVGLYLVNVLGIYDV